MKLVRKYPLEAWRINDQESYDDYPSWVQEMFNIGELSWNKYYEGNAFLKIVNHKLVVNTANVGDYLVMDVFSFSIDVYNSEYVENYYNEI